MKRIACTTALIPLTLLMGCNAVYFYETDKVSFTAEVRPDSTGPIQGNFGLKQRVVALVPKRNGVKPMTASTTQSSEDAAREVTLTTPESRVKNAAEKANAKSETRPGEKDLKQWNRDFLDALADQSNSDALDVLSALRFHKLPKPEGAPWYKISHMTIDSALITGGAARHVANPAAAIAALSGTASAPSLSSISAIRGLYEALVNDSPTDPSSAEFVQKLDALAATLPPKYPVNIYEWSGDDDLAITTSANSDVVRKNFGSITNYWSHLEDTLDALEKASKREAPFTIGKEKIPDDLRQDVQRGLAQRREEVKLHLEAFRRATAISPAIRESAEYFASKFKS